MNSKVSMHGRNFADGGYALPRSTCEIYVVMVCMVSGNL